MAACRFWFLNVGMVMCALLAVGTAAAEGDVPQTLEIRDPFDDDTTLLIAPGEVRSLNLLLCNPDSVIGCAFVGTLPPHLVQTRAITVGTGWQGTGYHEHWWYSDHDNGAGAFEVLTGIDGSPGGLSCTGRQCMAQMHITASGEALNEVTRVLRGRGGLNRYSSSITRATLSAPETPVFGGVDIILAYLGDIASVGAGTGGTVPAQVPNPDGQMTFDDALAFTIAWNGLEGIQDPLGDMNTYRTSGLPCRDGMVDAGDREAFVAALNWFSGLPDFTFSRLGTTHTGATQIRVNISNVEPAAGDTIAVTFQVEDTKMLTAAMIRLSYDPGEVHLRSARAGEMISAALDELVTRVQRDGVVELNMGRLDVEDPGASGSGRLAEFIFEALTPAPMSLSWSYDLRNVQGAVLARGSEYILGSDPGPPEGVALEPCRPNPCIANAWFSVRLFRAGDIDLAIFDAGGRRVRTLFTGHMLPGHYPTEWDGRDEVGLRLPGGVYFSRLQAGKFKGSRRIVLTR